MTINVHSKNSQPQTTITKFNIIKQTDNSYHQMKHGKKTTNPYRSQSAEPLTEDFFYKIIRIASKSAIPLVEQSITKTKRQKRTVLQNIQENQSRATPHLVEKNQSIIQKSIQK